MKIFSKRFNTELKFSDDMIISMPWGIPGFPDSRRFCILDMEEPDAPFKWLHDVEDTSICLLITDPYNFFPDYKPELNQGVLEDLGINDIEKELMLFSIVKITNGGTAAFTNLRAPVVINTATKEARQVILEDDKYSVKTSLFQQLEQPCEAVNS